MRAAAASWQLPREQLTTEPGQVVHGATGRRASYGELAALAAQQPVPGEGEVTLKDSRIIACWAAVSSTRLPRILSVAIPCSASTWWFRTWCTRPM